MVDSTLQVGGRQCDSGGGLSPPLPPPCVWSCTGLPAVEVRCTTTTKEKHKSHFRLRCQLWRAGDGKGCIKWSGIKIKNKNPPTLRIDTLEAWRVRVCATTKRLSRSTPARTRFVTQRLILIGLLVFSSSFCWPSSFQATEDQYQKREAAWTFGWHHLKREEGKQTEGEKRVSSVALNRKQAASPPVSYLTFWTACRNCWNSL